MGFKEIRKDFEVEYRFYRPDEGGRTVTPAQGYRSDWSYEGDKIGKTGIYMIWPIFLTESGDLVEWDQRVSDSGKALMHIVVDEALPIHAARIKPGVRGYFMEGPNRVAEATVTKVLALAK